MPPMQRPRNFDELVNAFLALHERVNLVIEAQLTAATTNGQILAALARIEGQRLPLPPPLPTHYRDRQDSTHEWDPEVEELRATVKTLVSSPKHPRFNSMWARSKLKRATESLKQEGDARAWQALRGGVFRVALTVAGGVLLAALGYLARTWLAR
jgi:hypothetical protein